MTKANANAAANAQEQQAAQQQILRDLLALGKKNGRLTLKEISDALSHLELSSRGHRQGVRDARDHGHRGRDERCAGEGHR